MDRASGGGKMYVKNRSGLALAVIVRTENTIDNDDLFRSYSFQNVLPKTEGLIDMPLEIEPIYVYVYDYDSIRKYSDIDKSKLSAEKFLLKSYHVGAQNLTVKDTIVYP